MRIVTLIPYRPANDRQRWCWDQVLPALEHLGWPVVVGEPDGDEWSRAQAVNNAAKDAGDWDVALVGDCDTLPDAGSIRRAIAWVGDTGGAVRPHMQRIMLNQKGSVRICQRGPQYLDPGLHYDRRQWGGGGLLVITREAFDRVGGYDPTFIGWGYEDTDMNLRLLRAGLWERLPGTAWHLWHSTSVPRPESRARYRQLLLEYRDDVQRWAFDKGLSQPQKVL